MRLLKRILGKRAAKKAPPAPRKRAARTQARVKPQRKARSLAKPQRRAAAKKRARAAPKRKALRAPARAARKAPRIPARRPARAAAPRASKGAKRPARKDASQKRKERLAFIQPAPAAPADPEAVALRRKRAAYPPVEWTQGDRIRMIVSVLKDLVRKGALSDWRVNLFHVRSAQLYLGKGLKAEDQISSIREDISVTAYRRFGDGSLGEAQSPVTAQEEDEVRAQLLQLAAVCEHTKREAYALPEPEEGLRFPDAADPRVLEAFLQGDGMRVPLAILAQAKAIVDRLADVSPSSCEIVASASGVRVLNSNGVDASWHQTALYMELALTCALGEEAQESWWRTTVASPEQLDLRGVLEQQAQAARDAAHATPNPGFSGDVLLSGQSLLDFFVPEDGQNAVVVHAFARLKRMGLSRLELGVPIGQFKGEPFTLSSDPTLPFGLLSAPVDEEGTPLRPVDIVRTGVFANRLATQRYAQLMRIPATGTMRNVHVSDGATREEHLRGHNYFEIVRFSWFNPDPLSGDFSAEVRLGYHWLRGRKIPFKGGHFTGNVFDCLLNARFSREAMQSGRYYGPRALLFKDATVTKREEEE